MRYVKNLTHYLVLCRQVLFKYQAPHNPPLFILSMEKVRSVTSVYHLFIWLIHSLHIYQMPHTHAPYRHLEDISEETKTLSLWSLHSEAGSGRKQMKVMEALDEMEQGRLYRVAGWGHVWFSVVWSAWSSVRKWCLSKNSRELRQWATGIWGKDVSGTDNRGSPNLLDVLSHLWALAEVATLPGKHFICHHGAYRCISTSSQGWGWGISKQIPISVV